MSSKMLSLLLSGASEIHVELLPLPFGMNENFPVVGDGCACGGKGSVFLHVPQQIHKIKLIF